jgi:hypothetical protein
MNTQRDLETMLYQNIERSARLMYFAADRKVVLAIAKRIIADASFRRLLQKALPCMSLADSLILHWLASEFALQHAVRKAWLLGRQADAL